MQLLSDNHKLLQAKYEEVSSVLNGVSLENEQLKTKYSDLSRNFELTVSRNQKLEDEVWLI